MSAALMKQALALVLAAPDGIKSIDVARAIDRSQNRTQQFLSQLWRDGKIGRTGLGVLCRWTRPGDESRVHALLLGANVESAKQRGKLDRMMKHRVYSERRREARQASKFMEHDEPIQRIVPADKAPRLKTRGVASVFALVDW